MEIVNKIIKATKELISIENHIHRLKNRQLKQSERFLKALWRSCSSYKIAETIIVYNSGEDRYSYNNYKNLSELVGQSIKNAVLSIQDQSLFHRLHVVLRITLQETFILFDQNLHALVVLEKYEKKEKIYI